MVLSTGPDTRADRFYAAQGWQCQHDGGQAEAIFTLHRPGQPAGNEQR